MIPQTRKSTPQSSVSAALADGSSVSPAAKSQQRLGRFRITSKLGKGGMGTVYRAVDEQLGRYVALKVISKDASGKPTLRTEAFLREARSVAQLDHPNIVQLFEIGQTPRYSYIAMELLEGGDLWQLFRAAGPLDFPRAALIVAEAAEALHHAHGCGVIHRDIKPANLMLARNGRCKITDFGLARHDNPNDLFEFPSQVVGTPFYIAPELITGQNASPAVDVYSLAVTLWIVLVGSSPFSGKGKKELYESKLRDPLPDLRQLRPDLPAKLIEAVERGLEKDPAQRVGMEQFGRMLRLHTHANPAAGLSQFALQQPTPAPLDPGQKSQATAHAGASSWSLDSVAREPGELSRSAGGSASRLVNALSRITPAAASAISVARSPRNRRSLVLGTVAAVSLLATLITYRSLHDSEAAATQLAAPRASSALTSKPIDASNTLEIAKPLRWQSTTPVAVKGVIVGIELSGDYLIRFQQSDFVAKFSPTFGPAMQAAFGGEHGKNLIGKTVIVTGPVSGSRTTPMIEVTEAAQIFVTPADPPKPKTRTPLFAP